MSQHDDGANMSAEVAVAAAAGVGTAGLALVFDQNIALASAGGLAFMLAVSVTIPLQARFFFGVGSFILGYFVGLLFMAYGNLDIYAALTSFCASALGSSIFGSLHQWADGGPTPKWVLFLSKLIPFSIRKGGGSE